MSPTRRGSQGLTREALQSPATWGSRPRLRRAASCRPPPGTQPRALSPAPGLQNSKQPPPPRTAAPSSRGGEKPEAARPSAVGGGGGGSAPGGEDPRAAGPDRVGSPAGSARGARRGARERAATRRPRGAGGGQGARPPYLAAGGAAADADEEGLAAGGLLVLLQGLLAVPGHARAASARARASASRRWARPARGPRSSPAAAVGPGADSLRCPQRPRLTSPAGVSVMPLLQSGGQRAAIRPGGGGGAGAGSLRPPGPPRAAR